MVLLTPAIESKGNTAYISKLTTYTISFLYFLTEFVLAIVVFIFKFNNTKVIVSLEALLTTIYVFALIPNLFINDLVASKQALQDTENGFIKAVAAKAKHIEATASDMNLKNKINSLYHTIHSSPARSIEEVAIYERKIAVSLDDLEILVEQDKAIASEKIIEIEKMLSKRNSMLRKEV